MQPFLAMIMPVGGNGGGNYPDNTLPVPPPRWDTFPKPLPPGYPPVAGWPGGLPGGGGFPGQGGPVDPGYSPPWARPQPPVAGWPGGLPGGGGFPGQGGPYPDNTLPQPPLGIWGGGNVPYPTPPIYFPPPTIDNTLPIPPDLPPTLPDPDNRPIEWKAGWTPMTGWVVVGIPQGPVPTPSKGQSKF